jgi:D-3-phosphoglycerate dehydrogenase
VNAPMVPAEVLAELQPFVALAQGLGTAAVQLVGNHGFTDVFITYASSRGGAARAKNSSTSQTPSACAACGADGLRGMSLVIPGNRAGASVSSPVLYRGRSNTGIIRVVGPPYITFSC